MRILGAFLLLLLGVPHVRAQTPAFDAGWYDPARPHLKIGVVEDGIYAVTAADLQQAGFDPATLPAASLRLLANGRPVPFHLTGTDPETWAPTDSLLFVGHRNTGADEAWAWNGDLARRSSDRTSLYTDTTFYWLTWGGTPGLRYEPPPATPEATPRSTLRTSVHLEQDRLYYFGDSDEAAQPAYTRGEGFYWDRFSTNTATPVSRTYTLPTPHLTRTDDSLYLRVRLSSESAPRHRVTLEVEVTEDGTTGFRPVDEADWSGYAFQTLTAALPQHLIPATRDEVRIRVVSHNEFLSVPNRVLLDWIEASYVRSLVLEPAAPLRLEVPDAGRTTLQVQAPAGRRLTLLDPADATRQTVIPTAGGTARLTLDLPEARTLWLFDPAAVRAPVRLARATGPDWSDPALSADYVIITTPLLRPSAEQLAAYRREQDGYEVHVIDQQDLFDQFDYGRPTPIAIRRFLQATRGWTRAPRYLTLWGDLLRPEDGRPRRPLGPWEVISFGYAPADGWFAMQLTDEADWSEGLAVGRIPLRSNDDGQLFLDKLTRYENAPPGDWQKRAIQLAGGFTPAEQQLLQNYTLSWGAVLARAPMGADTLTFFKNVTEPLDPSFQDSLRIALRNGAGWLTYFGHSAADSWEIVTDDPEEFDNADRLPVVLSLGCNTGNVAGGQFETTDRLVLGERLVIGSANGAIAHWGASSPSTITLPGILAQEVHAVVFRDTVRVLGVAFQEAKRRFAAVRTPTSAVLTTLLQYGLIGDPATRLNLPTRPDLLIPPGGLSVSPVAPILEDSSLTVHLRVRNRGLVPADSVLIRLTHTGPDGNTQAFARTLPPVFLSDTLHVRIPLDTAMIGDNHLRVEADPFGAYPDADPFNNATERTLTVFASGVALVEPPDLGLVTTPTPRLRVGLSSRRATSWPVVFELDTSATFTSPALRRHETSPDGPAATWTLTEPLPTHRPVYWRARLADPAQPENWRTAVFTVDPDAPGPGWNQQGPLFARNAHSPLIEVDRGTWAFRTYRTEVRVTAERGSGFEKGQIVVNGEQLQKFTLGFGVVVLDGDTGALRYTAAMPTYQPAANLIPAHGDSTAARLRLDSLLALVEPGDYVFVRTRHLGRASEATIQEHIKARWRRLGSTAIDTLTYNDLWIMMARVGFPEDTQEWAVPASESHINEIARETTLSFTYPEGTTTSPPIGPALDWDAVRGAATLAHGDARIRVEVLSADARTVLLDGVDLPGQASLQALDARQHPYVRLRATLSDPTQTSTPQLDRWLVTYTPVPELAADPATFTLSADTLQEGQPLTVTAAVTNLSAHAAPEVHVAYVVTDAANHETLAAVDTLRALAPEATATSTVVLDTEGLAGTNRLRVQVGQPGRVEPVTYNNVLLHPFTVWPDREPPALTVRIDGQSFPADPDPVRNVQDPAFPFVSARPVIEVLVEDANPYRPLQDSNVVQITFDREPVPLDDPSIAFEAAPGGPQNRARLTFTPDLSGRDTTHTLVVRAFDAAGNEAEGSPYQVHFRVQRSVSVESLYPYPNPMSRATRFAFLLRGADPGLVEDFRIRIFTLTGRLVREFDLLEDPMLLDGGGLRIGWNTLRWDGRDADGDLLATGVYLYKVYLRADGQTISVNNETGIEKLVVLR